MPKNKSEIEVFKRSEEAGAFFYYRFAVPRRFRKAGGPERVMRCAGTVNKGAAQERGWEDYLRFTGQGEAVVARVPMRSPYRLLKEAAEWYEERAPVVLAGNGESYRRNVLCLKRMVERVGGDWELVRLDFLTSAAWEKWVEVRYAEAGVKYPAGMKVPSRLNGSLNSEWRQIKSMFGELSRREIFAGWEWPVGMEGFISRPALRAASVRYEPIPNLVEMDAYFGQISQFWARMGYELGRFCGLRRGEIIAARWEWLEGSEADGWILRVEDREATENAEAVGVKNKRGRAVPVAAARVARWREWAEADGCGGASGYLVRREGVVSASSREVLVGRELSLMVSKWLPEREKSLHELRKAAGSEVLRKTGSMAMCAEFLGDTIAVAESHYGRVELLGRMVGL